MVRTVRWAGAVRRGGKPPGPARVGTRGVALALVAVTLLASSGCGSGVAPDVWAGNVCAAVLPWRDQIAELNHQAERQMAQASTPAQARANLLELLTGGQAASERAYASVVAAGVPDVDDGDEIARRFAASLAGARDAYARAHNDLLALAIDEAGDFYTGVTVVLARLTMEYAASGMDTSHLDSLPLREAFDRVEQCQ